MRYILIVAMLLGMGFAGYKYGEWKTDKKWHGFMEIHLQKQFRVYLDNQTFLFPPGEWTIQ